MLSDATAVSKVAEQQREILSIEMEAYGIFVVAEESPEPRPRPFVVKSIVDFGDASKDDRFQAYAAYTSARFLAAFAERYL